jgi:hypothetical protein
LCNEHSFLPNPANVELWDFRSGHKIDDQNANAKLAALGQLFEIHLPITALKDFANLTTDNLAHFYGAHSLHKRLYYHGFSQDA